MMYFCDFSNIKFFDVVLFNKKLNFSYVLFYTYLFTYISTSKPLHESFSKLTNHYPALKCKMKTDNSIDEAVKHKQFQSEDTFIFSLMCNVFPVHGT